MRHENIPIPERMKKFKLWKGYPIHYTVMVNPDGTPDFKIMHEFRRREAFGKNLCHLCGERMTPPFAFIGGPQCVRFHRFIDGPMHIECAEYAAQVCPFLRSSSAHYSKKTGTPSPRPHVMYLCVSNSYHTEKNAGKYGSGGGIQALNPHSAGQMVVVAGPWEDIREIVTNDEEEVATQIN